MSYCQNNIWIASGGFVRKFRVMIASAFARKPFDHQVVSLDVPELAKFVKELAPIFEAAAFGQFRYRMRWVQYREPVLFLWLRRPCGP